jgi:ABC-type transport system involved in multi-copper enzyme maturation permease subunit
MHSQAYSQHIYNLVYSGTAKALFSVLVLFLGLGGLFRERANGTAVQTLVLPVSRMRLIGVQIGVGLGELTVLALLPAVLIPCLSPVVHHSYPLAQALHFSVLWIGGGTVIFALAFFLSTVLRGEYTAPLVHWIVMVLHTLVASWGPLRPYRLNLLWIMGEFGTMHWDPQRTILLAGPLPWLALFVMMLIASVLFCAAARATQQQDF